MTHKILQFAAVALLTMIAAPAAAWDAAPPPGDGRSHVAPKLDSTLYDEMRECLAAPRESGAQFWAVVVNVTDQGDVALPSANDAVPFVDHVYQQWRAADVPLDPEKHILIALGLLNRAVAIHPGTYWANIGFENRAITSTIDGSKFKMHARAGDYPKAVCALINSVEQALKVYEERAVSLRRVLPNAIDDERQKIENTQKALDEADLTEGARQRAQTYLNDAKDQLEVTASLLESGRVRDADLARHQAESSRKRVENDLRMAEDWTKELEPIVQRRDRLQAEVDRKDDEFLFGTGKAQDWIGRCNEQLNDAQYSIRDLTDPQIYRIDYCLNDARREMNDGEMKHVFATQVVPAVSLIIAILAFMFWVFRRRARCRRAKRRFAEIKTTWDDRLAKASARLLELEESYPSYFGPTRVAWTGKSQELDQSCADAVNEVFLLLNEASDRLERAEKAASDASSFDFASVEQAVEQLSTDEVVFETGEKEKRRRIFLPLTTEYRGQAADLLRDLQDRYVDTTLLLDRVTQVEDEALAGAAETRRLHNVIIALAEERAGLGADPSVLLEPSRAPLERAEAARSAAKVDPIAAIEVFETEHSDLQEVERRGALGNRVLREFDEIAAPLGRELVSEIEMRRSEGMRLSEDGFDPDVMLEHARGAMGEARAHVRAGEEDLGKALADRVHAILQDVRTKVEASVEGRDQIPDVVAEQRAMCQTISERLPGAREVLAELEKEHASESFANESNNVEIAERLLSEHPEWCDGITQSHAAEAYLRAWTDLEVGWRRLREADELIDKLHAIREALTAARDTCRTLQDEIDARLGALDRIEGDAYIGEAWREDLGGAKAMWADALEEMSLDQPNWPECASIATVLGGELSELEASASEFRAAWEQARKLVSATEAKLAALASQVRDEKRDRPHVEQAVQRVQERRAAAAMSLEDRATNGVDMMGAASKFQSEYDWAHGIWVAEMEAVRTATNEFARVERELQYFEDQATGYGYGVVADFSLARTQLSKAREHRDRRAWEAVIEEVARAEKTAEMLDRAAEGKAKRKRDAARRAARLASQRSSYSSSRSSSSSSSSSFSSSSSSFSSSSSSSFSSSSGGSSFGSSSGGSSW